MEEVALIRVIKTILPNNFEHFVNITTGDEVRSAETSRIQLAYVTGIVDTHLVQKLERSIFRMTRGKAILSNKNFPKEEMEQLRRRNPERFRVHQ